MAAILGVEPEYKSSTIWFHRNTSLDEIVPLLEDTPINKNNPWYARLLKITEFAARRAKKDYCIAMTDLGGVLDILSSFLGPEKIIITMKRQPELIDTCRAIILEKLLKVYDDLQIIIERYGEGCSSWMQLWCPKRWYPIQSDFSYILSPKWFKRFALPDIITQAEHLDYALYHLDGKNQLVHLDDLLAVPAIQGIQWVPGASEAPKSSDKWMPVYEKIQAAGKNIFIDFFENEKRLSHFYNQLDPKGLMVNAVSFDNIALQFHLPKSIGGQGGEGDFKEFRRTMRKQLKEHK
jgi:5-methyltetrahydrofolate--homocysteine methyltransferase